MALTVFSQKDFFGQYILWDIALCITEGLPIQFTTRTNKLFRQGSGIEKGFINLSLS